MVAFFLQYLRFQKRRSRHTISAYEADLKQFQEFASGMGTENPETATKATIRAWIIELSDGEYSPNSINRKLSSLRAFFDFLLREGKISSHPMTSIRSLKKPKRLPVYVRENNMKNLFENYNFSPDFSGQRDRLILELLYGTGMRLSELIGLKPESISFEESKILVFGKRSKERWIPLHQNLVHQLKEYLTVIEKTLPELTVTALIVTDKGKPAYPVFIERVVKKYLGLVTSEKKKSPHVLRHTFASHLLNAGAEISSIKELLGHTSLAATQVYAHNTVAKLKQAYGLAHPRAKRQIDDPK
jgi:integrase/recombinase XerC